MGLFSKEGVMAIIDPALQSRLEAEPAESVSLIIRTQGPPHVVWMESQNIKVDRQFRLSPGAAISCTGAQALTLLSQDWVISVESDQPVSAF
jgi:hypothetical protein